MNGSLRARPLPAVSRERAGAGLFLVTLLLLGPSFGAGQQTPDFGGPYLGQAPPGATPVLFAPAFFIDPGEYHSPVLFSPEGTEAYWSPMPGHGRNTSLMSELKDGSWTRPRYVDFGLEAGATEVTFSPDGRRIYFLSTQLVEGERLAQGATVGSERIWSAPRAPDGRIGTPQLMPPAVTGHFTHWKSSVAANGNLYFTSHGRSGDQAADIYVAPFDGETYLEPRRLGPGVNSAELESCPYVSPGEEYLIFVRYDEEDYNPDLFISYREPGDVWSEATPLPFPINTEDTEICPAVSPDGRYLFFLSWREGAGRIFWVEATFLPPRS